MTTEVPNIHADFKTLLSKSVIENQTKLITAHAEIRGASRGNQRQEQAKKSLASFAAECGRLAIQTDVNSNRKLTEQDMESLWNQVTSHTNDTDEYEQFALARILIGADLIAAIKIAQISADAGDSQGRIGNTLSELPNLLLIEADPNDTEGEDKGKFHHILASYSGVIRQRLITINSWNFMKITTDRTPIKHAFSQIVGSLGMELSSLNLDNRSNIG